MYVKPNGIVTPITFKTSGAKMNKKIFNLISILMLAAAATIYSTTVAAIAGHITSTRLIIAAHEMIQPYAIIIRRFYWISFCSLIATVTYFYIRKKSLDKLFSTLQKPIFNIILPLILLCAALKGI